MTGPTATHCPYCSLQCGIMLLPRPGGGVELTGREDFPVNRGGLCVKGVHAAELLGHRNGSTTPLVRRSRGDLLRPASWEDTLDRVATAIRDAQQRYGPHAVGCFGGGGLTNEKL